MIGTIAIVAVVAVALFALAHFAPLGFEDCDGFHRGVPEAGAGGGEGAKIISHGERI